MMTDPEQKSIHSVTQNVPGDNNIVVAGDINGVVVTGNNNQVNQTVIQKFFNIFRSDAETVNQRNRRILLGHVENFWVKGVLEQSLHGAALLDLGIKEDPKAVKYPWAIKKETTGEVLPAGTSMLDVFEEMGMGRSLLILGAPGAGKTTMLLELTRLLIERARQDATEPIPMVFNLASWTEKLTLADWLAQELNNLYYIPRKTTPDWVKGNKLLLLLDGLDEVRQESRAKCVYAINQFRKDYGLSSLVVSSRSQDYADLNEKLSFEGAIEVQPLTQEQIVEFFSHFGKEMAGIRQTLEKDAALREMAETPLFLSIMTLAYRDTSSADILIAENFDLQREHLFKTYIKRMFMRSAPSKNAQFNQLSVLRWLSWLAHIMITHNQVPYLLEQMQPIWLSEKKRANYKRFFELSYGWVSGLFIGGFLGFVIGVQIGGLFWGLICSLPASLIFGLMSFKRFSKRMANIGVGYINTIDHLTWDWQAAKKGLMNWNWLKQLGIWRALPVFLLIWLMFWILLSSPLNGLLVAIGMSLSSLLFSQLINTISNGLMKNSVDQTVFPGQKLNFTIKNTIVAAALILGLPGTLLFGLIGWFTGGSIYYDLMSGLVGGLVLGIFFSLSVGISVFQHYSLRYVLAKNDLLPWKLIPFLDHCVDLIFLRRVGGGYIFVHRLLMEHFAEMYKETNQSSKSAFQNSKRIKKKNGETPV